MERDLATRLVQVGVRTWNAHTASRPSVSVSRLSSGTSFRPIECPFPMGPLYVTIDLDALDPAFAPASPTRNLPASACGKSWRARQNPFGVVGADSSN